MCDLYGCNLGSAPSRPCRHDMAWHTCTTLCLLTIGLVGHFLDWSSIYCHCGGTHYSASFYYLDGPNQGTLSCRFDACSPQMPRILV